MQAPTTAYLWKNNEYVRVLTVKRYGPKTMTGVLEGGVVQRTYRVSDGYALVWGKEEHQRKLEDLAQRARIRVVTADAKHTASLLKKHVLPDVPYNVLRRPPLAEVHKLSEGKLEDLVTALRWVNTILSSLEPKEGK